MRTLTSTLDHQLDSLYEEWENTFGIGPCGAYAALRREQGWGKVAVCIARAGATEFTHYIIVSDGDIIDLANPLGEELSYHEIELLDTDEMPECIDEAEIAWLRERM